MFWVRIRLGGREYLGVLDTGATISIVAKKILPCGSLKNTMTTAAIRMGDGHVVHSCGDCEVEVPMGSRTIAHRFYVMDTDAFDFVLGTDFFVQHSQIQSLTLQAPLKVLPWVDVGAGGLGAGKTSGAGTRGVSLDVVIGVGTGYTNTNGGESSDNRSKVHADCGPAENPSL